MSEINQETILDLVRKEVGLYQQLLQKAEKKLDLFLRGDLKAIEQAAGEEQALVDSIKASERKLRSALAGISLGELIEQLQHPYRTILESLVQQFRRLVQDLNQTNVRNYRYVQSSLSFTQSVLQHVFKETSNYDGKGYLQAGTTGLRRKDLTF